MIKTDDRLARFFPQLDREELMVFLVINRYLNSAEEIPLDRIGGLLQIRNSTVVNSIAELVGKGLIVIKDLGVSGDILDYHISAKSFKKRGGVDWLEEDFSGASQHPFMTMLSGDRFVELSRKLELSDSLNGFQPRALTFRDFSFRESFVSPVILFSLLNKIYYLGILENVDDKLLSKLEEINILLLAIYQSLLKKEKKQAKKEKKVSHFGNATKAESPDPENAIHLYRTLTRLKQEKLRALSLQLVNHFAERLVINTGNPLTPKWRNIQLSMAKAIIVDNPSMTIPEFKAAIDYFTTDEFWRDKTQNLSTVSKNMNSYLLKARVKKSSRTSNLVNRIG